MSHTSIIHLFWFIFQSITVEIGETAIMKWVTDFRTTMRNRERLRDARTHPDTRQLKVTHSVHKIEQSLTFRRICFSYYYLKCYYEHKNNIPSKFFKTNFHIFQASFYHKNIRILFLKCKIVPRTKSWNTGSLKIAPKIGKFAEPTTKFAQQSLQKPQTKNMYMNTKNRLSKADFANQKLPKADFAYICRISELVIFSSLQNPRQN